MAAEPQEFSVSEILKHEEVQKSNIHVQPSSFRPTLKSPESVYWNRFWIRNKKLIITLPLTYIIIFCLIQSILYWVYPVATVVSSSFKDSKMMPVIDNLNKNDIFLAIQSYKGLENKDIPFDKIQVSNNKILFVIEKKIDEDSLNDIKLSMLNYFNEKYLTKINQKETSLKNHIKDLKLNLKGLQPSNDSDYYNLKSDHDLKNYLKYGEISLKKQREYYEQIILIEEYARQNVVDVFSLRGKELDIPLLTEVNNLMSLIKYDQKKDHKEEINKLKLLHAELIKKLLDHEVDGVPEEYLTPARKNLIKKEAKLSQLWFDWHVSQGLYEVYSNKIQENGSNILKDLSINSQLKLAKQLFKDREELILDRLNLKRFNPQLDYHYESPTISLNKFAVTFILFVFIYGIFILLKVKKEKQLITLGSPEEYNVKFKSNIIPLSWVAKDEDSKIKLLESQCFHHFIQYFEKNKILNNSCAVQLWCFDPFINNKYLHFPLESVLAASKFKLKICFLYTNDDIVFSVFDNLDRSIKDGFVNFMQGLESLEDCVYATNVENVYLMPIEGRIKDKYEFGLKWIELEKLFDVIIISNDSYQNENIMKLFLERITQINCVVNVDTEDIWIQKILDVKELNPAINFQTIFIN